MKNILQFKLILAGIFLFSFNIPVTSQSNDTTHVRNGIQGHSPQKAVKYSIICPGLGQVYNKKLWKIPVIYGAGTAMIYGVVYNQVKYRKFKEAVFDKESKAEKIKIDGSFYDRKILFTVMRLYERNRDKCLIGCSAIYLLNVIDAMVDAYFFHFDISDDLSMQLKPSLMEVTGVSPTIGIGINFEF